MLCPFFALYPAECSGKGTAGTSKQQGIFRLGFPAYGKESGKDGKVGIKSADRIDMGFSKDFLWGGATAANQ